MPSVELPSLCHYCLKKTKNYKNHLWCWVKWQWWFTVKYGRNETKMYYDDYNSEGL